MLPAISWKVALVPSNVDPWGFVLQQFVSWLLVNVKILSNILCHMCWYSSQQIMKTYFEISPKQIEADLLMGNFGCLQKQYGRPVYNKPLLSVWVDWGGVVIDDNDRRKEKKLTCSGGTSCHRKAWEPSRSLISGNWPFGNGPNQKDEQAFVLDTLQPKSAQTTTGEQLVISVHLASRTGRSSPTCTQWHPIHHTMTPASKPAAAYTQNTPVSVFFWSGFRF